MIVTDLRRFGSPSVVDKGSLSTDTVTTSGHSSAAAGDRALLKSPSTTKSFLELPSLLSLPSMTACTLGSFVLRSASLKAMDDVSSTHPSHLKITKSTANLQTYLPGQTASCS